MLSKKLQDAINAQIRDELYSAYLYLSMAAYSEEANLSGLAHWMRLQSQEEVSHAMKFFDYVNERGGTVKLTVIDGPKTEWKSPLEAFEDAYNHEVKVTGLINSLVEMAMKTNDYATLQMLQWFVEEQVEEESSADEVVQKLKLAKDAPGALFMIDNELATRVFVPPTAEGK